MTMGTGQFHRHRVADLLRSRDLSKAAFAAALSVSPQTVSSWLAGRYQPARKRVAQMAEILGVPVATIWSHGNAPDDTAQDMYEHRLRELIADQPEHVKAEILAMVARELASRGPSVSGEDDSTKDDE